MKSTVHGADVLCLHSSASSGRQWSALAENLEPESRVRTPDLLGYGGNPAWPANRSITLAEEAAHLAPLIVHAPRPVHLVGHSYGAAVATRLALDHPDRVASLALFEPTLFSVVAARPERPAGIEDVVRVAERLAAQLASGDRLAGAETFVSYWGGADAWARLDDEQRARLARRVHKAPSDFDALFNAGIGPDDLARLQMPVLCLGGSASPLASRSVARTYATSIAGIRTFDLPGLGHMGPMTHPETINSLVVAFLARHTRAPALAARGRDALRRRPVVAPRFSLLANSQPRALS